MVPSQVPVPTARACLGWICQMPSPGCARDELLTSHGRDNAKDGWWEFCY